MISKATRRVSILVLPDSSMMTFSSILDPLRAANRLSRLPLFSWRIISLSGDPITLTCGVKIAADGSVFDLQSGDVLVVIAGFEYNRQLTTKHVVTIYNASKHFRLIFGAEAGAWVLAKTGIIKQQKVTTHWEDSESLALSYPNLKISTERYVIDQHIWTCGGASPALDMMLQYLRITQNRSLALDVASAFIYEETSSGTDTQPNVSLGRLQKKEPRLAKAIRIMESNIEEPISIASIAHQVNVALRTLENLSNKHLAMTPGTYYLRLRLQTAKRLVLDSNLPMLDVAIRSGFNSQSALSRAFKARYGQSPLRLRNASI
jgi:transcriptional regulator GlxA family with amidase domain